MLVEAVVDLLWSLGIGIIGIAGAILLMAGVIVGGLKTLEASMNYKVTQKNKAVVAHLQQRAIETHRRAELNAGTARIRGTIEDVVVIRKEGN
jgi:hypothetical protein